MLRKSLTTLFVIIAFVYVGISYLLSNRVLTPNSSFKQTVANMPTDWNTTFKEMMSLLPAPQIITMEGYEGIELKGQYFDVSDQNKCLYIFVHGWGTTWANMLKYYPMVDACKCDILMYDHRVHGASGGEYPTGGLKEAQDLLAVTNWVRENRSYDWNQIAWLGSSWGAATALIAGATNEDPAFIIADAPFQDWYSAIFERAIKDYGAGIKFIAPGVMQMVNMRSGVNYKDANPKDKATAIEEPVLLIHSKGDLDTSSDQSVNIARNLNELSEFHHTPWGNGHVKDVVFNTEEMKDFLMDFIEKNSIEAFFPIESSIDSIAVEIND